MNSVLIAVAVVVVIGLIAGVGLSVASVLLEVPKDEKAAKIREALPGANCGGCGYSGCDSYAEAVANKGTPTNLCAPGGADAANKIASIMGVEADEFVPLAAVVECGGTCDKTERAYNYRGIMSCAAKNTLFSGDKSCKYGCLGEGDCKKACPNGCISIVNGVASVDRSSCIGCGKCVTACPKGIIELTPQKKEVYTVLCSNAQKGAEARKVCKAACIGCGICLKQCEYGAVTLSDNHARINAEICTGCGKCAEKCPQKCIVKI